MTSFRNGSGSLATLRPNLSGWGKDGSLTSRLTSMWGASADAHWGRRFEVLDRIKAIAGAAARIEIVAARKADS